MSFAERWMQPEAFISKFMETDAAAQQHTRKSDTGVCDDIQHDRCDQENTERRSLSMDPVGALVFETGRSPETAPPRLSESPESEHVSAQGIGMWTVSEGGHSATPTKQRLSTDRVSSSSGTLEYNVSSVSSSALHSAPTSTLFTNEVVSTSHKMADYLSTLPANSYTHPEAASYSRTPDRIRQKSQFLVSESTPGSLVKHVIQAGLETPQPASEIKRSLNQHNNAITAPPLNDAPLVSSLSYHHPQRITYHARDRDRHSADQHQRPSSDSASKQRFEQNQSHEDCEDDIVVPDIDDIASGQPRPWQSSVSSRLIIQPGSDTSFRYSLAFEDPTLEGEHDHQPLQAQSVNPTMNTIAATQHAALQDQYHISRNMTNFTQQAAQPARSASSPTFEAEAIPNGGWVDHNFLQTAPAPVQQQQHQHGFNQTVVLEFKMQRKLRFKSNGVVVMVGQCVVVQLANCHVDMGQCCGVYSYAKRHRIPRGTGFGDAGAVLRVANEADCKVLNELIPALEERSLSKAHQLVHFLHLPFAVADAEFQFDCKVVIIYYSLVTSQSTTITPNISRLKRELSHAINAKVILEQVVPIERQS